MGDFCLSYILIPKMERIYVFEYKYKQSGDFTSGVFYNLSRGYGGSKTLTLFHPKIICKN